MILHFSTNLICFLILGGYSILGNKELILLNSWVQEFLYNLSDTIKAFSILLVTDLCIGFHSPQGWELLIESIYKDFGFADNDQIISSLVSTFPVILDTILKYWIFRSLNRVSPSLVVIYHSMNDWKEEKGYTDINPIQISNSNVCCFVHKNNQNITNCTPSLLFLPVSGGEFLRYSSNIFLLNSVFS